MQSGKRSNASKIFCLVTVEFSENKKKKEFSNIPRRISRRAEIYRQLVRDGKGTSVFSK